MLGGNQQSPLSPRGYFPHKKSYKTKLRLFHSPAQSLPMAFHYNQKKIQTPHLSYNTLQDLAPDQSLNLLFPIPPLSTLATLTFLLFLKNCEHSSGLKFLHQPLPTTSGFLNIMTTDIGGQRILCCGGLSFAAQDVVSSIPALYSLDSSSTGWEMQPRQPLRSYCFE